VFPIGVFLAGYIGVRCTDIVHFIEYLVRGKTQEQTAGEENEDHEQKNQDDLGPPAHMRLLLSSIRFLLEPVLGDDLVFGLA
jgi:hypothetical protein